MSFMEDKFEKSAKKMVLYGIIASVVSGAVTIGGIVVVLYIVKHLFF